MLSQKQSFIHPFHTVECFYLYDVNTNAILKVNEDVYRFFQEDLATTSEEVKNKITELKKQGFLKSNPIQKIEHPYTNFLSTYLNRKIQGLTLQVTQKCNFRCSYCVYSGAYNTRAHSSKSMTLEMAKKGIDFLFEHSIDLPSVDIGFYGGEPLLQFSLIVEVMDYIKKKSDGKRYILNMTTNGTLFTDEILAFLQNNGFNLTISLDGPKEIHDQNRVFAADGKGTFDVIMQNIQYAKNKYPALYRKIGFNAVLDPRLDPSCSTNFFINCKDLEENGITASVISPDFKKESIKISEKYLICEETEVFHGLMNALGRLSRKKTSKLAANRFGYLRNLFFVMRPQNYTLPNVCHPSGPCVPGARKLFMNVHGEFFPCESVSEKSYSAKIGSIEEGFYLDKIEKLLNIGKLTENACKKCWGIRFCPQCFAQADTITNLSKEKRLAACQSALESHDHNLREYCTMVEHGYRFDYEQDLPL